MQRLCIYIYIVFVFVHELMQPYFARESVNSELDYWTVGMTPEVIFCACALTHKHMVGQF